MISGVSSSSGFGFDRVYLSGRKGESGVSTPFSGQKATTQESKKPDATAANGEKAPASGQKEEGRNGELSVEEQRKVDKLITTDRQVRAHEQAHVSAGGNLVQGGANFEYETGPDGKRYAVAGEVNIDTSKERNPEETIPKAQKIRAAALAPADPSPQDNRVAAMATRMEMQAQQELAVQRTQEGKQPTSASDARSSGQPANRTERSLASYTEIARSFGDMARSTGFTAYA